MDTEQKIKALEVIQKQLSLWLAYAPDEYVKKHSMKEANEAYQYCKILLADEQCNLLDLMVESNQSLGLYNME